MTGYFLEETRFAEAEVRRMLPPFCPDDHVIDQRNLQKRPSLDQSSGQSPVGLARLGIPGGMIMSHGNRIGSLGNRRTENLPGMGDALIETPPGNLLFLKKAMARIQEKNP